MKTPELVIVDGASGFEKALAARWSNIPFQRRTVHKDRNLLPSADHFTKLSLAEPLVGSAHAPGRLHEEISADYEEMIYAGATPELNPGEEVATKRNALIRKGG